MFRLNVVSGNTQSPLVRTVWMVSTILITTSFSLTHASDLVQADRSELTLPRDLRENVLSQVVSDELAEAIAEQAQVLFDSKADLEEREMAARELQLQLQDPSASIIRSAALRRVRLVSAGLQVARVENLSDDVRETVDGLIAATSRYEDTSVSTDAEEVRRAWRDLKEHHDVMSAIHSVLMEQYFNYNVHITVSEPMLAQLIQDYRTENGTIAECILGAWVTGRQTTNASVTADVKRSSSHAHFVVLLNGQTSSNTQGRKKPATIYTRGNHFFNIRAPVYFDGRSMSTGGSTININTNNQTVGVKTDLDWIPLVGGLVRKIALKKAREKRAQSEQIAAQKLASRALPEFDRELNEQFAKANASIQNELLNGLNAKGVGPDTMSSRSSETHMAVSSRTIGTSRIGGSPQPFAPLPATGLGFQIHESAVNNMIDGLEFNGRSIKEDEFKDVLQQSLSDLLQRPINLQDLSSGSSINGDGAGSSLSSDDDDEPGPPSTFVFNDQDPVRIRFERDGIVLVLRMGVEQEGREPIPGQRVEIPVAVSLVGGRIVLTPPEKRTDITVGALEKAPRIKQIGRARQIQKIIQEKMPQRDIDGQVALSASDTKTINLNTVQVQIDDGWLYVELQ